MNEDAVFCNACGKSLKEPSASKSTAAVKSSSGSLLSSLTKLNDATISTLISRYGNVINDYDLETFFDARLDFLKYVYGVLFIIFADFVVDIAIVYDHYYFFGTEYPGSGIALIIVGIILASLTFYNMFLRSQGKNWRTLFQRGGYTSLQFKEYLEAKRILRANSSNVGPQTSEKLGASSDSLASNYFVQSLAQAKDEIDEEDLRLLLSKRLHTVNNTYLSVAPISLIILFFIWFTRDFVGGGSGVIALILFLLVGAIFVAHLEISQFSDGSLSRSLALKLMTIPPFEYHLLIFEEYLNAKSQLLASIQK